MRFIDADVLMREYQEMLCLGVCCAKCTMTDKEDGACLIERWINEQPTIDAVRVIRCRNCLSYAKKNDIEGRCQWHKSIVKGDDFCSYGIGRKE